MYQRPTNALHFYLCTFIAFWSSTCFGHSRGHLQGDFLKTKNTIIYLRYILRQMNEIETPKPHFFQTHFNIILLFTKVI